MYHQLQEFGVLKPSADNRHLEFTRDHAFSSASAAATVVTGRSANGRKHWIEEPTGRTYADWQEQLVNKAIAENRIEQVATAVPAI